MGDTEELCAAAVHRQKPTANGATYSRGGGTRCYAGFGMSDSNGSTSWKTCLFGGWGAFPGCTYKTGDGVGGSEQRIGDFDSADLCARAVHEQYPDANGATYSNTGGTACYAEYGMNNFNSNSHWKSCFFAPQCDYVGGDGVGGSERYIGDYASREACAQEVSRQFPDANGATYSPSG